MSTVKKDFYCKKAKKLKGKKTRENFIRQNIFAPLLFCPFAIELVSNLRKIQLKQSLFLRVPKKVFPVSSSITAQQKN